MNLNATESDFPDDFHKACNKFIKTDAFIVLPSFSSQIPAPPPTPDPYRVLPPIVSRKEPSFVILQEVGSRRISRELSSPHLGQVISFRGCGFKSFPRERSAPETLRENKVSDKLCRSNSRLKNVERRKSIRKLSKSVSPIRRNSCNISRPLNRKISYSTNQVTEIFSKINLDYLTSRNCKSSENLYHCSKDVREPQNTKMARVLPMKLDVMTNTARELQMVPLNKNEQIRETKRNLVKTPRRIPVPLIYAVKCEATIQAEENATNSEKKESAFPARSKTNSALTGPSKNISAKSKGSLLPSPKGLSSTKNINSNKVQNSPSRPVRSSSKSGVNPKKSLVDRVKNENTIDKINITMVAEEMTPVIATIEESTTGLVKQSTEQIKDLADKFNLVRTARHKALTTCDLLKSTKKKNTTDAKPCDRKKLLSTDTSRSLLTGSVMTESAVTLTRATTAPALAPIPQNHQITEIGSAINDIHNVDETSLMETPILIPSSNSTSLPIAFKLPLEKLPAENSAYVSKKKNRISSESAFESIEKRYASPRNSPVHTYVNAVTKTEELDPISGGKKQLLGSSIALSVLKENKNGINKSARLDE